MKRILIAGLLLAAGCKNKIQENFVPDGIENMVMISSCVVHSFVPNQTKKSVDEYLLSHSKIRHTMNMDTHKTWSFYTYTDADGDDWTCLK